MPDYYLVGPGKKISDNAVFLPMAQVFHTLSTATQFKDTINPLNEVYKIFLNDEHQENDLIRNVLIVENNIPPRISITQNRSFLMWQKLEANPQIKGELFQHQQKTYRIITRQTTDWTEQQYELISISANPKSRELIILDTQSARLQQVATYLERTLRYKAFSHLIYKLEYIGEHISKTLKNDPPKLATAIAAWPKTDENYVVIEGQNIPIIPLSYFIEQSVGECRQKALLAVFLIIRMIAAKMLPAGKVYLDRYTSGTTGHAVACYQPAGDDYTYTIDPTSSSIVNSSFWDAFRFIRVSKPLALKIPNAENDIEDTSIDSEEENKSSISSKDNFYDLRARRVTFTIYCKKRKITESVNSALKPKKRSLTPRIS